MTLEEALQSQNSRWMGVNNVYNGTGKLQNNLNKATPAANYIANPYLTAQLSNIPFQASPSMQQAYNTKMQGYGMTPQPFVGSPQVNGAPAPVKGGK